MRVPICISIQNGENGLAALQSLLGYHKRFVPTEELRKYCQESRNGIAVPALVNLAAHYNLDGEVKKIEFKDLKNLKLPCIIVWKKRFYCVLTSINNKVAKIMDPFKGNSVITVEKLEHEYTGTVIIFTPNDKFTKGGKRETSFSLLRKRLSPYKRSLALFVVLDIVLAAIGYVFLKCTTLMLDEVVSGGREEWYVPLLIALVCLVAGKFGFAVWKTLHNARVSRKMAANSSSELFERLLKMPLSFYESHPLGELNERLTNNSKVDISLMQSLIPLFLDAAISIVYLVMMFTYNIYVPLLIIGLEILHFSVTTFLQRKLAILMRSKTSSSGATSSSAFNIFTNIETIKSMGTERFYFNLWNNKRNDYQDDQKKIRNLEFTIEILTGVHDALIATAFLFFGAYLINRGDFSLGMLYSSKAAYKYVNTGIKGALGANKKVQEARTYVERAEDIKKRTPEEVHPLTEKEPDKLKGELSIKNLNYAYHSGDPLVLKNINIEIKPGEMIALVGSSGCGKTTLSKIVAGIYKQTSGEVLYDGKSRNEIADVIFHSSIASVDQETCVFSGTISENLKMFDDLVTDYEMILAANDAQIHKRIAQESKGYDSVMLTNGGNFSGGEIQRMELARALSQEPTLLILDEFTSALDAITEEKIFNAVKDKGTSAIVVAHRLSTIVNCDRIYVMDHGEIIEQGTHEELCKLGGYYYQLVSKQ